MDTTSLTSIPLHQLLPGQTGSQFRRDELAHTSYRPTVVIGIGGTGARIVRRLKSLLRRYYQGKELDIFQFIVFDTAAEEVPDGDDPLDAGEFVHLGAFDAANMIRHLDENPYVARWWPGGIERPYRPTFSGTGANRVRAVGRLVLFNHLSSVILPRLEAKINRSIQINAQHGMGATSVKLYVVGSLAGGTGSGMFVDLAYLARMLGLRNQPTAFVTGIAVLDDAFLEKAHTENTRAEFRANTYAALCEINHFSAVRQFHERYDDNISTEELPDGFRPFDICYLLGLHNADGQALKSFDSLTDMAAAEIMLEIASPLQGRTENVLDNVKANDRAIAGQPTAFSSFALSSLVYPLPGISAWCALAGHAAFSRDVLLSPRVGASEVNQETLAFLQTTGMDVEQSDQLLERLALDERGEPLNPPTIRHEQVDGLADAQLLGVLQRLEESSLSQLAQQRAQIAAQVPTRQAAFEQALTREANDRLRDPQRGPRYVAWILSSLTERLSAQREARMLPEQAAFRAEAAAHEAAWTQARDEVGQALRLPTWLPWRAWQLSGARSRYVSALNAYLGALFELERRTQAARCLTTSCDATRALGQRANDLLHGWQRLMETTQERVEADLSQAQATETEYSLMRSIVGADELRRTFAALLPTLIDPARGDSFAGQFWSFFAQHEPAWTLADTTPDALPRPAIRVYDFLAHWFTQELSGRTLIERLQALYGEAWPREIELRYRQTTPFWNYTLARYGDKIRSNLQNEPRLVGYGAPNVRDWSQSLAGIVGESIDGVNNKSPHEMLFLKTAHGLPLFALRSLSQTMRAAYQSLMRDWRERLSGANPIPLHVSSIWETTLGDVEPQAPARLERPDETSDAASDGPAIDRASALDGAARRENHGR